MPPDAQHTPAIALERFPEIDSTSLEARRRLADRPRPDAPLLLLADRQTGGVGRFGRRWESPTGGLWMTLLWPLGPDHPRVVHGLGLRVGLACARAVENALQRHGADPERARLKWPNDVRVDGRKVLGVLTEILRDPAGEPVALVGVGVNANLDPGALPDALRPAATTLRAAVAADVDLDALRGDLLSLLSAALLARGLDADTLRALRGRLHGVGEHAAVTLPGGERVEGELLGVDDDGRLRLRVLGAEWLAPPGAELAGA